MEIDAIHTVVASIHPETCRSILHLLSSSSAAQPPSPAAECPGHLLEMGHLRKLAFVKEIVMMASA
jgi:hypothetical protein